MKPQEIELFVYDYKTNKKYDKICTIKIDSRGKKSFIWTKVKCFKEFLSKNHDSYFSDSFNRVYTINLLTEEVNESIYISAKK